MLCHFRRAQKRASREGLFFNPTLVLQFESNVAMSSHPPNDSEEGTKYMVHGWMWRALPALESLP